MRFSFLFVLLLSAPLFGATFVLQDVDSNQFLIQEGDIATYKSPYCSFNIALSLIGFDTNALQDPENPLWPFKEEYEEEYRAWNDFFPEKWKDTQNPTTWMKYSCVWFSQALTRKLGMQTFANYIAAFHYGNQNLVGDTGKGNGLIRSWIGSSLRISPLEQVRFVSRLVKEELPVSPYAHACTKAILFVEELPYGKRLYGKTGSGSFAYGREQPELKIGWFVGWVEKGNRQLAFAYMVEGSEMGEQIPGAFAREQLKQRLLELDF